MKRLEIKLSKHALRRIKERAIDLKFVYDIISNPEQIVYDKQKDLYIYVSDKCAVVSAFHGSYIEVVTVLGKREFNALMSKYGYSRYKVIV
ncbi:MAG: DUF4258 domain-containing protein [Thermoprotei archaeon]|nr:MAG: DUF4258 domain-containing protein [Thermoprotei archaeon]